MSIREIVEAGETRYGGEWHTKECADRNQGMCCESECEAERRVLVDAGMPVKAADGESWTSWHDRMDEAVFNREVTHG